MVVVGGGSFGSLKIFPSGRDPSTLCQLGLRLSGGRVLGSGGGGVTFDLLRRPLLDLAAGVFQKHGSSLKFTAIVLNKKKHHTASSFSSPGKMDWNSDSLSEYFSFFGGLVGETLEKY